MHGRSWVINHEILSKEYEIFGWRMIDLINQYIFVKVNRKPYRCELPNRLRFRDYPRAQNLSARDSSAQTIRPIFQSGTTCSGPLFSGTARPIFFFFFGRDGGGDWGIYFFILFMCFKNKTQETFFIVTSICRSTCNIIHTHEKHLNFLNLHKPGLIATEVATYQWRIIKYFESEKKEKSCSADL